MSKRTVVLILIGLIAAAGGALLGRYVASRPGPPVLAAGTWLPAARAIPDVPLFDQTGAARDASVFAGAPALLFFGFTHCPDVCPTTLAKMAAIARQTPLPQLRLLFVSVDPERDDAAALARYVNAFAPGLGAEVWRGIGGPPSSIARLTASLGVASARVSLPGGDYTIDHSATIFLLDARGEVVAVFTPPFDVDGIVRDLRAVGARLAP